MLASLMLSESVYKGHWSAWCALHILSCVPRQHQEAEPVFFFLSESEEAHRGHLAGQDFFTLRYFKEVYRTFIH